MSTKYLLLVMALVMAGCTEQDESKPLITDAKKVIIDRVGFGVTEQVPNANFRVYNNTYGNLSNLVCDIEAESNGVVVSQSKQAIISSLPTGEEQVVKISFKYVSSKVNAMTYECEYLIGKNSRHKTTGFMECGPDSCFTYQIYDQ